MIKSKTFFGLPFESTLAEESLVEFINSNRIKREDIVSINHIENRVVLYYY